MTPSSPSFLCALRPAALRSTFLIGATICLWTTAGFADGSMTGSLLHYRTFGHGYSRDLPEEITVTSGAGGSFFFNNFIYTGGVGIDVSVPGTGATSDSNYDVDFPGANHQVQLGSYAGGTAIDNGFVLGGPTNYYLEFNSTDWQILEAAYAADGTLTQLAANFELLTANGQRALQGEVRYHSSYPLRSNLVFARDAFTASQSDDGLTVTVIRNGDAAAPTSVDYHTEDYGARAGRDYTATQGTLTWVAGDGSPKTFTVPLLHRPAAGNRVFSVHLDGSTTGDLVTAAATIADDTRSAAASLPAPSGTVDATYPIYLTNSSYVTIGQILSLADGSVLIVGTFNLVNGQFVPGLVRLDPRGQVDAAFHAGLPAGFTASRLALQPDGKLIVGGGVPGGLSITDSLVRLNTDGSQDASFQASILHGGGIFNLTLQQDGRLVVTGNFQEGNGLLRLSADGSVDASFVRPTTNILSEVEFALLQPDGKLLVSNEYGQVTRLNSDASVDGSFQAAATINAGQHANTVAIQPDGKLIALTYYLNTKLSRFNGDGTLDPGFSFDSTTVSKNAEVSAVALQSDGKVLVALKTQDASVGPAGSLVRLNTDGTLDPTFQAGPELPVSIGALTFNPNGTLFVSGGYYANSFVGVVHTVFARLAAYPGGFEPTVTMSASVDTANRSTGEAVTVTLARDGDLSAPLVVNYQLKGKAVAGVDYQLLSGHKKIKAGQSTATVKIRPLADGLGRGLLKAKLSLQTSGAYRVGTTSLLKVKIADQVGQ